MEATLTFTVTDADTAAAVGSGSLAGPRHAAAAGLVRGRHLRRHRPALPEGSHQRRHPGRARAPGRQPGRRSEVEVTASASYVDGRLHRFTVAARHLAGTGKVVGTGEITRVVVDAERFLSRL